MTQPEVSQPSAPIVYYSGRATGLAPFLRTVKLALWGVVWLAIYWTLDPGNRELLAAETGWTVPPDLESAVANYEYSKPVAEIGRLVLLAFVGIVALKIFWAWMGWNSARYLVTSDRIQFERGVLAKTIKSVELWRVRDLIFQRRFGEALFGMGSIVLVANDVTSKFSTIGPVSGARRLYDNLVEARTRAIRERGVSAVES